MPLGALTALLFRRPWFGLLRCGVRGAWVCSFSYSLPAVPPSCISRVVADLRLEPRKVHDRLPHAQSSPRATRVPEAPRIIGQIAQLPLCKRRENRNSFARRELEAGACMQVLLLFDPICMRVDSPLVDVLPHFHARAPCDSDMHHLAVRDDVVERQLLDLSTECLGIKSELSRER